MQNYSKKGEKNEEFGGMGDCAPKDEREMHKNDGLSKSTMKDNYHLLQWEPA